MAVYEGYNIYGPYKRKDGRQHIVLTKHDDQNKIIERKTVSYPKYLVEVKIGRYLTEDETVDHIDGNFDNNDYSNLRVVDRRQHCKSHAKTCSTVTKNCVICGKQFSTNDSSRITCGSKVCAGKCAHVDGYNKGNSFIRETNHLISNRSLIQEIESVETAKSGKPLVGNPEQGV